MESFPVKYRPKSFKDVKGQTSTIEVLERQLETGTFSHAYLFCGPSGDGKTTIARIFASELNNGHGSPIEVDGASNNGVDNVRVLIEEAKSRAIDSEYKVIIVDECHALTNQAWNAFLKCIEETPPFTVFVFCTTDPQKIPKTITNRVTRFDLTRLSTQQIKSRLTEILAMEGCQGKLDDDCLSYISRISNGCMRQAISYMEKVMRYAPYENVGVKAAMSVLGRFSYDVMFDFVNNLVDCNEANVMTILDGIYEGGGEIATFFDELLGFVLDLAKYSLLGDIGLTKIPPSMETPKSKDDYRNVKFATGFEGNGRYFSELAGEILRTKSMMKNETSPLNVAIVEMVSWCNRGRH